MGILNKRKVFEKLRGHRYFLRETPNKVFVFECPETYGQFEICFRNMPKGVPYPIGWDSDDSEIEMGQTPKWFQDLFTQTYEWYFERDQEEEMKLILHPQRRRHYKNILFMAAIETGVETDTYFFEKRINTTEVRIDQKEHLFLTKSEELLKKYDYHTEVEKQENEYLLKIKEA